MRRPPLTIGLAILLAALMLEACALRAPASTRETQEEAYPHGYDGAGGGGGGGGSRQAPAAQPSSGGDDPWGSAPASGSFGGGDDEPPF